MQLATLVHQIVWCQAVEAALSQAQPRLNLSRCFENMQQQLAELSRAARGHLTNLQRIALMAMITLDVHMRDVTENLIRCFPRLFLSCCFWHLQIIFTLLGKYPGGCSHQIQSTSLLQICSNCL